MFKNSIHLFRIFKAFSQHGLLELLENIDFLKKYMWLLKAVPTGKKVDMNLPRGERLCMALEQLGPVFVKFGQMLSTRPDLLPLDIATSLIKLQDKVEPFPAELAAEEIENALGQPITILFKRFEAEPAASASVAQVHYATLHDDTEVVVKVLRPGIDAVIERDLTLLHSIADVLQKYWGLADRIKPKEIVEDYDRTIHDELDLKREAANASQLKINFQGSDLIYVPEVYWDYIRANVMVMERIYGISIRDIDAIKAAGIDLKKLAHEGVEIFFTQAFRDGFFHADMHPGNIFVSETGQYRAVDFGIMGTLDASDRRYLAENLLAFFDRDYLAVAEAHIRSGWVPPETDAQEFESAVRTVCEPIFAKPISEISFGSFLIDLFKVARRFKMPVQPQLVLLQKTLLNIEGLGRQLYPDLDLWETAQPFLKKWMSEQIGPRAAIKTLRREMPNFFTLAPEIPALSHQLLHRLKNDEIQFRTRDDEIAQLRRQLQKQSRRLRIFLFGSLITALALFVHYAPINFASLSFTMQATLGIGAICMLWAVLRK